MSSPLVSVITPTRNRHDYVATAVRSALAQTYSALEVVVIDDGSTPPIELPPDLVGDGRVHLMRVESSVGAGEARNIAVAKAEGSLIAFLDDDDEWFPEKLERQVEVLLRAPESVGAVETGYELVSNGEAVFRYIPRPDRDLRRALLKEATLAPSTMLIRKSVFEDLQGFDPSLQRVEDWELWVRFADRFDVVGIEEVLVRILHNPLEARFIVHHRKVMLSRLEPRIAALPLATRLSTRSYHAAVLWAARARAVVGESRWRAVKSILVGGVRLAKRARGRDPLVRRW